MQAWRHATVLGLMAPVRTSLRTSMKVLSRWRKIWRSMKLRGTTAGQHSASKQKRCSCSSASKTGGSWKKSPQRMTWMPPNGRSQRRTARATYSILSNSSPLIIDTSSTTSTSHVRHRWHPSRDAITCRSTSFFVPRPSLIAC